MHEHHGFELRQHDIRLTGQILPVKPEPEPLCVQIFPYHQLRPCVLTTDTRHDVAALFRTHYISHTIQTVKHKATFLLGAAGGKGYSRLEKP